MLSEYVLLLILITARAGWRDVDFGNDQLCIPYISFYGKFFQVGTDSDAGGDGCLEKVIDL